MMKIKEYIILKDKNNCPKLKNVFSCDWEGNLVYLDEIHRMLNEVFYMNQLSTETAYVISFDHAKNPKGICKIGQGNPNSVAMPMQNIFMFLMLTGANSFIIIHNHVSNIPNVSEEDIRVTGIAKYIANMFDIEFIGHMIVHPKGYTMNGSAFDNCESEENSNIEYLENGMAATYLFGNRIEGKVEEIKKILGEI